MTVPQSVERYKPIITKDYALQRPTAKDYKETEELFMDFIVTIFCDMPDFETRSELFKWRKVKIKEAISKCDKTFQKIGHDPFGFGFGY